TTRCRQGARRRGSRRNKNKTPTIAWSATRNTTGESSGRPRTSASATVNKSVTPTPTSNGRLPSSLISDELDPERQLDVAEILQKVQPRADRDHDGPADPVLLHEALTIRRSRP